MRTKNIVLMLSGIFALVFALSFVIADAEFVDATTSSVITTLNYGDVNQGQSATASFKICDGNGAGACLDADADSLAALLFNAPVTFTNGVDTFVSAVVVGSVSTLLDDATSSTMSLTISVPSTKKGTFTGTLILDGEEPALTPFVSNPSLALSVTVKDVTAPAITITGGTGIVYVALGATYTDAGATALDATDGTVVASTTSNNVNTLVEGVYSVVYTAVDLSSNSATATRTVIVYTGFCASGSSSTNLDLSKFDISNSGRGEDNKWYPLDTIEIDVEFDNNRNSNGLDLYDLADVTFQLGVFDSTGKNVAGDMIWLSKDEEKFEFGDVDEGDDAKHTFKFRVDPAEFDISKDYKVKVKAFPAGKEATDCVDFSNDMTGFGTSKYSADVSIKMAKDENAVIVDKETLPLPAATQCGQKVTFTADVWNTGDQDWEDQVLVTLLNTELGVSTNQTLVGDLDQGAMKQVTFSFNVPEDMEEKQYDLEMKTYYSWDADNSEYDEVSAETFKFPLSVAGNCVAPTLTVSASLESGGKAGETLVVKGTMTNTGTEEEAYTFVVSGYSEWASSAKLNGSALTLAPGQSGNILVSFEVDKKTSGDQTFNIEAYSADGKLLKTQPVQVGIEGRPGLLSDSDSLVAILIALISAIVIAIIIVLIVKASKRKS